MSKYIVILPDGSSEEIAADKFQLDQVRAMLGGWAELISVHWEGKKRDAYVDEEGGMKNLPENPLATELHLSTIPPHILHYYSSFSLFGTLVIWIP